MALSSVVPEDKASEIYPLFEPLMAGQIEISRRSKIDLHIQKGADKMGGKWGAGQSKWSAKLCAGPLFA